jgi:hypothetical protein
LRRAVVSVGKNSAGCRQCDYCRKNNLFHVSLLLFMSAIVVMTGTAVASVPAVVSAVILS